MEFVYSSFRMPDRLLIHQTLNRLDVLLEVSKEYSPKITEKLNKLSDVVSRSTYNLQIINVNYVIQKIYRNVYKEFPEYEGDKRNNKIALENFLVLYEDVVLDILTQKYN